ncbi:MAG: diaminopimelate epimerase [Clostridia bacterium]|nr:diaminopimelate epimerase [Clostridia bacterium]
MRKIAFTKMHGAGNDYIYIDLFDSPLDFDPNDLARKMSPRHFSVGGDGVVLILPSTLADAKMRMFNLDGSEGKMCGNAIRCVAKYLSDHGLTKKDVITVETLSGIKTLRLFKEGGKVKRVSVEMGVANFTPAEIPVLFEKTEMVDEPVTVLGKEYRMTAVSMGNPHAVIFTTGVAALDLAAMGPTFETLPIFPERVNTEFAEMIDDKTILMRVWERGSGETFACGTGASATVAAAVKTGRVKAGDEVTVRLLGGDLTIKVDADYAVTMTGGATEVYQGVYIYDED